MRGFGFILEYADGIPDKRDTSRFDLAGNLILREWDQQADGYVDHTDNYTFDDDGKMLTAEVEGPYGYGSSLDL